MTVVSLSALIVLAYLFGSVPFGLLVGRMKGVDVRTAGSKNIGATNVGRLLGKRYFYLVTLLDASKSLLPLLVASGIVAKANHPGVLIHTLWIGVGLAAMLGHIFSLFLGFKGGKGVATGGGIVLGVWPYFTLAGVAVITLFAIVVALTRYISLGSIAAAVGFPVFYILLGWYKGWPVFGVQLPLLVTTLLVCTLILWRHRENFARLRNGTEKKFGERVTIEPAATAPEAA